jgi:hypothetical protein
MLETQISQVAQQQASTAAPADIFPGQPEQNPKGHVNAVISRNGTQFEGPADPKNTAMQPNIDDPTKRENDQNEKDKEEKSKEVVEKKETLYASTTL